MEQRASTWWRDRVDRQSLLAALWFALNLESGALSTIVLPLGILRLAQAQHTAVLGRVAALGSFVALVVPPVAGYMSDRLRQGGRPRMPLVVGGSALNVLGLVGMAGAQSLLDLAAGYLLATLGQNASMAAYEALVPDIVPPEQWGSASGYMGVFALLGTVVGLAAAGVGSEANAYGAMLLSIVFGTAVTALGVHEDARPASWRPQGRAAASSRRRGARHGRRAFALVFAARLSIMFGLTLLMTFVLYYLRDVLGMAQPARGTAAVAGMALVGATVSTFVAGRLSDRVDRTAVVFLAGLPMALSALGFAFFPSLKDILALAVVYGLGYGVFLSTDWALALDTLPDRTRAGRDLGIWGMASNLPAVFAPVAGSWLIARYASPAVGYRMLFVLSGLSFLAGSLLVLRAGRLRPLRAVLLFALRLSVAAGLLLYARTRYRVRIEGRLPRRRHGLLVVANHLHDLDGMVLPALLYLTGPLGQPPVSAGSQRLFEPGFLADRLRLSRPHALTRLRLGGVLSALGVVPIEDRPRRRPLAAIADTCGLPPRAPLSALLTPAALAALEARHGAGLGDLALAEVSGRLRLTLGAELVSLAHLAAAPRTHLLSRLRLELEAQVARLERLIARGRTLYLTPEGMVSPDGRLHRFRLSLDRLLPRARAVYLAALAYDDLRPGRLRLHLRLVPLAPGRPLRATLLAERTVTVSQVLARCLLEAPPGASVDGVAAAATAFVASLPATAHLDPDLRRRPGPLVRASLRAMARRGQLAVDGAGRLRLPGPVRDPAFPAVDDMLLYHRRFLEETLAALEGRVGEAEGAG
ncbi:MAG: MFS transporter [Firmicutes bacterium]|nr:MFS transporter [Bacillota bacterium]